jgi:hypothetical protein
MPLQVEGDPRSGALPAAPRLIDSLEPVVPQLLFSTRVTR